MYHHLHSDNYYSKIRDERQHLPIYPARGRLIQEVQRHDSVVIIGETGSGKTTQIPQVSVRALNLYKTKLVLTTPGKEPFQNNV